MKWNNVDFFPTRRKLTHSYWIVGYRNDILEQVEVLNRYYNYTTNGIRIRTGSELTDKIFFLTSKRESLIKTIQIRIVKIVIKFLTMAYSKGFEKILNPWYVFFLKYIIIIVASWIISTWNDSNLIVNDFQTKPCLSQ